MTSTSVRGAVARISIGAWFELYDLFMTAYIALGMIREGLFTATSPSPFDLHGFAGYLSCGFAGMFFGTMIFTNVSDRFGRKAALTYSLVWYSAATLVMAFMQTAVSIDVWRFIAGIGIGVQLVTSDAYTAELVPKEQRGSWIAFTQVVGYTSIPVAALFAYLLVPHEFLGLHGWRYVAMIGSLGGIAIWFIRPGLPDSARWRSAAEKRDDAGLLFTLRTIWNPFYRGRTAMLSAFNVLQTIGFYGFSAWVPIFLATQGIALTKSLQYSFIIAVINPLGPVIAMYMADRFERKWQIVWLALTIGVAGYCFAQMRAPAPIIFFGIVVTLANAWFSTAFHAYQAELFPTRIRGQAVGFVYAWSRFSSIFVSFIIAAVLRAHGTVGVFLFIGAAMALVAVIIGVFGPRTNRIDLDALAPL